MRAPLIAVLLLWSGCGQSVTRPEPCPPVVRRAGVVRRPQRVNLLLVVDNSRSMLAEQIALQQELPRLVEVLATGDFDEDGDGFGDGEIADADIPPATSLQVGVIVPDLGSAGYDVPTCRSERGEDGMLRTSSHGMGCMNVYPRFLGYSIGDEPTAFIEHLGCVASTGGEGCGFEQPLEAALKALSPTVATSWTADGYAPPRFFGDSLGHADGANDGFLRDDALLAVLLVTDEDDCSVRDPELFDIDGGPYGGGELNFRCTDFPEALHPAARYVDGLLQLRRDPSHVVFTAITGIPRGTDTAEASTDYEGILAHPAMQARPSVDNPSLPAPGCSVPGSRFATPPRRVVEAARGLADRGGWVSLHSICNETYRDAIDALLVNLGGSRLPSDCVGNTLPIEPDGSVGCEVDVVGAAGSTCDVFPGSTPRLEGGSPLLEDGAAVCTLAQLVPASRARGSAPPVGAGWYYDDFTGTGACGSPDGARIVFAPELPNLTEARLRCPPAIEPPWCSVDADCADWPGAVCEDFACTGWTCE